MQSKQSLLTIASLAAIGLVGCSSPSDSTEPGPEPTHFSDEGAFRKAVEDAGLNCNRNRVVKSEAATSITCSGTMSIALYDDPALLERKRAEFFNDGRRVLAGDSWLVVESGGNDLQRLQQKIGGSLMVPNDWTHESTIPSTGASK